MKNYLSLYKNPQLKKYFLFTMFFFLVMNLSKALQVLWFDENNKLANFGLSYSSMAFAGVFSFYYAPLLLRVFGKNPLVLPLAIYSLGMALRTVVDSTVVAIISGLLAGIGASTALNAFRTFLAFQSQKENFDLVLSHKNVLQQSASSLGAAMIGLALACFSFTGAPYQLSLLICAVTMFTLALLWPAQLKTDPVVNNSSTGGWKLILSEHSFRTFSLTGFSLLMGLAISCTTPFLLVMLKHQGIPVSQIGLLAASGVGIGALTQTLVTPKLRKSKYLTHFIVTETLLALVTVALTLKGVPPIFIAAIYVTRLFVLSLSMFLQEALEYQLLPKKHASEVLGMMQSAFLVGDMLGGSTGGLIADKYGIETTLQFGALLFALNGILFVLCVQLLKSRGLNVEVAGIKGA
jgi:hypothetical protein